MPPKNVKKNGSGRRAKAPKRKIVKLRKRESKRSMVVYQNPMDLTKQGPGPTMIAPASYAQTQRFSGNKFSRGPARTERKSEFIGSILGSVAFAAGSYLINPGVAATFPWLSKIAAQFQQYAFRKLCFRYVTRSPTTSTGSVILTPEYNVENAPPTSEVIASNTQDAVEDVVWKTLCCILDPGAMFPLGPRKLIRTGPVAEPSVYDAARFSVCTVGQPNANEIGKLWVDYEVDLFVPQTANPILGPSYTNQYELINGNDQKWGDGVPLDVVWSANPVNDPLLFGPPDAFGVFTPPPGSYYINLSVMFSGSTGATVITAIADIMQGGVAVATPTTQITPGSVSYPTPPVGMLNFSCIVTITPGATFGIVFHGENYGASTTGDLIAMGTRLLISAA